MIYKEMSILELLEYTRDKTLICFGAGRELMHACWEFSDISFFSSVDMIADNDETKCFFTYANTQKPVYSIKRCLECAKSEPVILITVADCFDVIEQLEAIPELEKCTYLITNFVKDYIKPYDLPDNDTATKTQRIPKTIHYCWFGGAPLPDEFLKNINSWKKFCPDYEIVRWDESNYDYKKNEYMYEAYMRRKWGFVSDYARFDIVNTYGGIYFDADVEIIKNIDNFLYDEAFIGFYKGRYINSGSGFGAVSGFALLKDLIKTYDNTSFICPDGTLNLKTNLNYETPMFQRYGLVRNNTLQVVKGMKVYPSDVFSPKGGYTGLINVTNNTHSIHHYAVTWHDEKMFSKRERAFQRSKLLKEKLSSGK